MAGLRRRMLLLVLATAGPLPALAANHGPPLTGEEIRALVVGKTQREVTTEKPIMRGESMPPPSFFYLRADGTAYMSANRGQTIHRGNWDIENTKLCLPDAYWPCAVFHSFAGRIYKDYGGPHGSRIVELEEGDPEGLADTIDNSYPYNGAKPVR